MERKIVYSAYVRLESTDAAGVGAVLTESKAALQAMRAESGLTAEEKITLIDKIAEINARLEYYERLLTQYDSTLDYSKVEIRIDRPASYTGAIVGASIVCVVLAAFLVAVIVLSVKLFGAKKRAKLPPPQA